MRARATAFFYAYSYAHASQVKAGPTGRFARYYANRTRRFY
jgi:hypothetical protein